MFDIIRIITGPLSQVQVDSINAILKEAKGLSKDQIAYILATAWHESRFKPIEEYGSDKYLKKKPYYPFIGRGFVQLTWEENYKKYSKILGIDLVNHPEKVLDIEISAFIIVHGMKNGTFTGKKLSDYINENKTDFYQARRIINILDKASLIKNLALKFRKAL